LRGEWLSLRIRRKKFKSGRPFPVMNWSVVNVVCHEKVCFGWTPFMVGLPSGA